MCVRPILLPFLLMWVLLVVLVARKARERASTATLWIVVALSPVLLQLVLAAVATGRPVLSRVGADVFEKRFFTAV